MVEVSKFFSSCGTPQIKSSQTLQVTLALPSESWSEEIEGSEDDIDSSAESIQRGDGGWGRYLTFAEGSEEMLEASAFSSTKVDFDKVAPPEIGFGNHRIDLISSRFQERMWELVARCEVDCNFKSPHQAKSLQGKPVDNKSRRPSHCAPLRTRNCPH